MILKIFTTICMIISTILYAYNIHKFAKNGDIRYGVWAITWLLIAIFNEVAL